MPLEETLIRLAYYIPGTENLANIEGIGRKNSEQLSWGLRSTFQVSLEARQKDLIYLFCRYA